MTSHATRGGEGGDKPTQIENVLIQHVLFDSSFLFDIHLTIGMERHHSIYGINGEIVLILKAVLSIWFG